MYNQPTDIINNNFFLSINIGLIGWVTTNVSFDEWVFRPKQNQWISYIKPLFRLPFCYFSLRKSCSGMVIFIFPHLRVCFGF